jgi:hypothetical protein
MHVSVKNTALRVLLLAGYCFLFSVQLCFRYGPASLDLDAYTGRSLVHQTGQHVSRLQAPAAHAHHILNKRFEPVVFTGIPVQEFRVAPFTPEAKRTSPRLEHRTMLRSLPAALLRGTPRKDEVC